MKQKKVNTQNVCPFPNALFMAVNVDVIKNANAQLNAPAAEPATPLMSFENNSPIIIHGIGPSREREGMKQLNGNWNQWKRVTLYFHG